MTGQTERVILIKGDGTKWYNQAIFIVNQDMPSHQVPTDFVAEAERIINNYLRSKNANALADVKTNFQVGKPISTLKQPLVKAKANTKATKKKGKIDLVLNILMMVACAFLVAVLVYGLLS